jgi:hypothetical protein
MVKKSYSLNCIANRYVITTTTKIQLNYSQSKVGSWFYAESWWKVIFVVRSGSQTKLLDAKKRVLKWKKLNRCFYLTPYGGTDLPTLEKDLAKIVGPWVSLVFKDKKLHTTFGAGTDTMTQSIQIAAVVISDVTVTDIPCGTVHTKPIVHPIKIQGDEPPHPKGGGTKDKPPPKKPGEGMIEPIAKGTSTPLEGTELGPAPTSPGKLVAEYTDFEPSARDKKMHRTKLYTIDGTYEQTMEQHVEALQSKGLIVRVERAPEHDTEYTHRFPAQSGGAYSIADPTVAQTAFAYQVKAYEPSIQEQVPHRGHSKSTDRYNELGY